MHQPDETSSNYNETHHHMMKSNKMRNGIKSRFLCIFSVFKPNFYESPVSVKFMVTILKREFYILLQ